ncbi:MAG: endolytic transglycosylase MltG [Deltaproteobacteria bacterium]|nr:endolytic transglycosylase MltG [Deltaproteobacteria bacterium]
MARFSLKRAILLLSGLLFLVILLLVVSAVRFLITPAEQEGREQVLFVQKGLSLNQVASELERRNIIVSKALFGLWGKIMGSSRRIKAGEYRLSPNMPPIRILEILTTGAVITYPVTFPEGYTIEQIADVLDSNELVEKEEFVILAHKPAVLKQYNIVGPSLEGYLYPDTYHFPRGISPSAAIDAMISRFRQLTGPLEKRAEVLGMTMEEVIILASIVEKETGLGDERPKIASVFLNRLKQGMRLESDPTVIYGINGFNGNLTRKDLEEPTLYNTYVIRGLPIGPIANPGLEAIKAVLFPEETDYLYFVSKNDGSHHFSKTLSDHNMAVRFYQRGGGESAGQNDNPS